MLKGKKIILGISASIAAYKAILLLRLLKKEGAEVRVVMTESSKDFVSPLVLSTLSEYPVWSDFHNQNVWNNHVELGLWADAMVIAPATANTISKMASGLCDNILMATYLSAHCPIFIAPAMDEDMFKHPTSTQNLDKLKSFGYQIIQPGNGFLASGLIGDGRLAEPEEIVSVLEELIGRSNELRGKKVLINAGPTQEAIDPVRYITNHSSGKMGIALAEVAYQKGAEVELVLGPTQLRPKFKGINVKTIISADEMLIQMLELFDSSDIVIGAAAVADYKSEEIKSEKFKKKAKDWNLKLVKNPDILGVLGSKKTHQKVIGFALETQDEEINALTKLKAKNLDAIVLNSLKISGAGFSSDTNHVKMFFENGIKKEFPLNLKTQIANQIFDSILELY